MDGKDKSDLDAKSATNEPAQAALDLVHVAETEHVDPAQSRALLWKIDLRLMPLLCITYALQSIDKTTLGYAAVFNLQTNLGLKGDEYSWLGAIFYLGYLAWEFPTNMMLQRLPINYFMSFTVSRDDISHLVPCADISGHHLGSGVDVPCQCRQLQLAGRRAHIPWRF